MALVCEFLTIIGRYTASFLTAMLQGMKTKGDEEGGFWVSEDADDAALFAGLIVIMVKDHRDKPFRSVCGRTIRPAFPRQGFVAVKYAVQAQVRGLLSNLHRTK